MGSQFTPAYAEIRDGLSSNSFSSDNDWKSLIAKTRKLVAADGFDAGQVRATDDLRKLTAKVGGGKLNEADWLLEGAGVPKRGSSILLDAAMAKRLASLKTVRHTYLLKRFGGHKVWVVSLPMSFTEWPHDALKGDLNSASIKLSDVNERFSTEDRKHLSNASQEGLKWLHKAAIVAANPKKKKNFPVIARWFADNNSTDEDMYGVAATLLAGLKKITAKIKSGNLIYVDSVSERGTQENVGTEAFVWGDALDVVYIEDEFFGNQNTLTGLTNWARIVVHELTHRELATEDHAYEHQGINPKKLTAAKAIENADSWAWFCADCAGMLHEGVVTNALNR